MVFCNTEEYSRGIARVIWGLMNPVVLGWSSWNAQIWGFFPPLLWWWSSWNSQTWDGHSPLCQSWLHPRIEWHLPEYYHLPLPSSWLFWLPLLELILPSTSAGAFTRFSMLLSFLVTLWLNYCKLLSFSVFLTMYFYSLSAHCFLLSRATPRYHSSWKVCLERLSSCWFLTVHWHCNLCCAAELVDINSLLENGQVVSLSIGRGGTASFWIGLNDRQVMH